MYHSSPGSIISIISCSRGVLGDLRAACRWLSGSSPLVIWGNFFWPGLAGRGRRWRRSLRSRSYLPLEAYSVASLLKIPRPSWDSRCGQVGVVKELGTSAMHTAFRCGALVRFLYVYHLCFTVSRWIGVSSFFEGESSSFHCRCYWFLLGDLCEDPIHV